MQFYIRSHSALLCAPKKMLSRLSKPYKYIKYFQNRRFVSSSWYDSGVVEFHRRRLFKAERRRQAAEGAIRDTFRTSTSSGADLLGVQHFEVTWRVGDQLHERKVAARSNQSPQDIAALAGATEHADRISGGFLAANLDEKRTVEWHTPIEPARGAGSRRLRLLTYDDAEGRAVLWHSSAHLLGLSLENMCGTLALLRDGPPLQVGEGPLGLGGFYYDVQMGVDRSRRGAPAKSSIVDVPKGKAVAARMRATLESFVLHQNRMERLDVYLPLAELMFCYNPYKLAILRRIGERCGYASSYTHTSLSQFGPIVDFNTTMSSVERIADEADEATPIVTVYRLGHLIDLCRGPHLEYVHKHIGEIHVQDACPAPPRDGDEAPLHRFYAITFPSTVEMERWRQQCTEAQRNDHRVIGAEQQLFHFDALSPGSAFVLPRGTRILNALVDHMRRAYVGYGYDEVMSPLLYDRKLWERSGHWAMYREHMFAVRGAGAEDEESDGGATKPRTASNADAEHQCLKAMNCPGHCLLFGATKRSWRDLPIRYADFSPLHRNELRGALSGLTRLRRFHQDDAHIFCTAEQVESEIRNTLRLVSDTYARLGFDAVHWAVSTRPDKSFGTDEQWERAEKALIGALEGHLVECVGHQGTYQVHEGDGAFYGPKIDVLVHDASGRAHQLGTIQLDFVLPVRFELSYEASGGQRAVPVMVHRAVLGSLERAFAVLCEHHRGRWPFWMSPYQCLVVSVNDSVAETAVDIADRLAGAGRARILNAGARRQHVLKRASDVFVVPPNRAQFHVDVDLGSESVAKRLKLAYVKRYNYTIVVGAEDVSRGTLRVKRRDHNESLPEFMTVEELLEEFEGELIKY